MANSDYSGYTITLEPMTGERFGLDYISDEERATIDEEASCHAYAALMEKQIHAAYPGAAIQWIDAYARTLHVRPGVTWDPGKDDDETPDEEAIWLNVCAEASRIFDDGNLWIVEK